MEEDQQGGDLANLQLKKSILRQEKNYGNSK
jgi:hypothetical protein